MSTLERRLYRDGRLAGTAFAAIGIGIGLGAGIAVRRLLRPPAATALAAAVCAAGRMLDDEALAVAELLHADDIDTARQRVRTLVGRDTTMLDASGISRAVVESVAENCVDAVTATLWWATVGGAPLAVAHRAVNTLDAMVGHRNERYQRFGWASARLDDVANWLPSRLTALAVAACRPSGVGRILRTAARDGRAHPSPNGGLVEAAFAEALGLTLGGVNTYDGVTEQRGTLGSGRPPTPADITAAVRLRRRCTAAAAALLTVLTSARRLGSRSRPARPT